MPNFYACLNTESGQQESSKSRYAFKTNNNDNCYTSTTNGNKSKGKISVGWINTQADI